MSLESSIQVTTHNSGLNYRITRANLNSKHASIAQSHYQNLSRLLLSYMSHFRDTKVDHVSLVCGLVSGVAQAGVFNPMDRALFLSVKNRTPFLSVENWRHPYQAFLQTVGGRAVSGGLYFPLEHLFMSTFIQDEEHNSPLTSFLAGTAAGATNAMILNPLSAIKYKTWGRDAHRGMMQEAMRMYKRGGLRPFTYGLKPTIMRDVVFGGTYTLLRLQLTQRNKYSSEHQWFANICAAALATLASGPLNLVRNVQYATPSSETHVPTIKEVMLTLRTEVSQLPSWQGKVLHVQERLRIGWGTARVAMGMAFAHYVYDLTMEHYGSAVEE